MRATRRQKRCEQEREAQLNPLEPMWIWGKQTREEVGVAIPRNLSGKRLLEWKIKGCWFQHLSIRPPSAEWTEVCLVVREH